MTTKNTCPECGADDTASIEVTYLSQTRTSRSSLIGLDANGDLGIASIGGTSTSLLGSAIAPPPKRSSSAARCILLIGWVGGVLALLLGFTLAGSVHRDERGSAMPMFVVGGLLLVCGALALPSLRSANRYNRTDWPRLYDRWKRQWLCRRCGHRWTPGAATTARNDPIPENFGRTVGNLDAEITRNMRGK